MRTGISPYFDPRWSSAASTALGTELELPHPWRAVPGGWSTLIAATAAAVPRSGIVAAPAPCAVDGP